MKDVQIFKGKFNLPNLSLGEPLTSTTSKLFDSQALKMA